MKATVVDYGLGNLYSVMRALDYIGAEVELTCEARKIKEARKLILPGVGSFGDGMKGLIERGLIEAIKKYVASGKPLLGICLGMQLLMTEGEEFGMHEGLDIIKGKTVSLRSMGLETSYKLPHIGWSKVAPPGGAQPLWTHTFLEGLNEGDFLYFIHSNVVVPDDMSLCLSETVYGDIAFCSALRKENIYGCQFHPERSGEEGLKIYEKFIFDLN